MMKGYTPTKSKTLLVFMGIILSSLSLMASSVAQASEDDSDRPSWAGNSGKDGKPGRGNNEPGVDKGDLYGDLLIIVRDDNGVPIKYSWSWDESVEPAIYVPKEDSSGCLQPIANEDAIDALTGEPLLALPEEFRDEKGLMLIPLDIECEIPEVLDRYTDTYPDFAAYAEEVDFGRLSVARSPVEVLNSSYDEAMRTINSATSITTDPAGRIQVTLVDDTDKTIDSPLENLALYKALMINGHLPGLELTADQLGNLNHLLGSGTEAVTDDDMNTAAALLAGSGDKFGVISLDLVININTFLAINSEDTGYFNFIGYHYDRGSMYSGSKAELLVPDGNPISSLSRGEEVPLFSESNDYNDPFTVFSVEQVDYEDARGFTQAADDALRVVNYIHNWALPELPEGVEWAVSE